LSDDIRLGDDTDHRSVRIAHDQKGYGVSHRSFAASVRRAPA
jgi:hypothetical protein